ncbi:MAG: DUF1127 domain-containing protein [Thalassobaculum sp.]|uniref:DUF1127 domain-containing protein n=1 Tax=Thalassobaculum sp. TaxID=2022740 RepID=UPI0032ED69B2
MAIAVHNTVAASADTHTSAGSTTLLDRLVQLLNAAGDGVRRSRAQDRLGRLDDRTLKDIGVHRSELSSILHHDLNDPTRRAR